jgi:hypothetical protein
MGIGSCSSPKKRNKPHENGSLVSLRENQFLRSLRLPDDWVNVQSEAAGSDDGARLLLHATKTPIEQPTESARPARPEAKGLTHEWHFFPPLRQRTCLPVHDDDYPKSTAGPLPYLNSVFSIAGIASANARTRKASGALAEHRLGCHSRGNLLGEQANDHHPAARLQTPW